MYHVQSMCTYSMASFILNRSLITSDIWVLTYLPSVLVSMTACQDYLWVIYIVIKILNIHVQRTEML